MKAGDVGDAENTMPRGRQRGNKEAKKPKQPRPPPAVPAKESPRLRPVQALLSGALLMLATAGCATKAPPPTDQMTVAQASVDSANMAGAQGYAPAELRLANEKLASAQRAMAEKDYVAALRFAQQSQADAQLASSRTQAAKARQAADEAQAAARAIHEQIGTRAPRAGAGGTP